MLDQIQHTLVEAGDQRFLTVVINGTLMPPIDDSHPNFEEIREVVTAPALYFNEPIDAEDLDWLADKFDVSQTISKRFEKLSERVTVNGGKLFFDGDEIDGTVVETILRFLDEGVDDFKPLVNYIEKIASNPEQHSREQLFDWLRLHDTISITPEGDLIAYKGVSYGGTHPETGDACYRSGFTGTATVDGTTITGHIPNYVGAEVTMPRSQVAHDPRTACHTGLHVGTFDYARGYARGAMLAVRVNPRDVVSVPTDGGGAKIRVCRYVVEEVIEQPKDTVLVNDYSDEEDSDGTIDGFSADVVLDDEAPQEAALKVGDRIDYLGIGTGTVIEVHSDRAFEVRWDDPLNPNVPVSTAYGRPEQDLYEILEQPSIKVGDFVRYEPYASTGWIGTVRQIDEHPDYDGGRAIIDRPTSGVGAGDYWYSPVASLELFDDPNGSLLKIGDRVVDEDGDEGTVVALSWAHSGLGVKYDISQFGTASLPAADLNSPLLDGFWSHA